MSTRRSTRKHEYNLYTHKQGDSFKFAGPVERSSQDDQVVDFTGWGGKAELRSLDDDRTLIAELAFSWIDPVQGICRIGNVEPTDEWPLGRAFLDIEFITPKGDIVSTETVTILIKEDVTQ